MIFNSIHFAFFFPIVFLLYYLIPHKFRWVFLLLSSYYFYMSYKPELIVLVIFSTLVDYLSSIFMVKYTRYKKLFLTISIVTNLGLLFFFKYFNFFGNVVGDIMRVISVPFTPEVVDLILPIGISFYTFQTMSYTIDVYKGKMQPEKHLGYFALYVSFFPQLVAGPIERADALLPQFKVAKNFIYSDVAYGIKLMAWGFFKKLVIADNVAYYVNLVYNDAHSFSGGTFVVTTVFFAFQIYCDFSGYSDIAKGAASMMGIKLMDNFKSPYISTNIQEFWRKWHVSLSNWFRDYVYIPLGGNKRYIINTIIVFGVSGLWHGANYTFIIWGLLNGAFIIIYRLIKSLLLKNKNITNKVFAFLGFVITFMIVCFTWIFFRANSIYDAMHILSGIFSGITDLTSYVHGSYISMGFDLYTIIFSIAVPIILLFIFDYVNLKENVIEKISAYKLPVRWTIYIIFILYLLFASQKHIPSEFIYFQF